MKQNLATSVFAFLALSASVLAQTSPPIGGTVPLTPAGGPIDNVKGNWINFETSPIAPIFVEPQLGAYLFAPNQPALRLSVFYLPTNALVAEIPTGPGIVSLVPRPNSAELWGIDSETHSVIVFDVPMQVIARTIVVGKEPHGITFLPSGSRAYVACSASDQVDVIDTATYSVVTSIPTVAPSAPTPLYLRTPRAIAYQNGKVWVASFRSGNNTTAKRDPAAAVDHATQFVVDLAVEAAAVPGTNVLPDQDVLAIDPATDTVVPSLNVTGVGTILLNMHARPGTNELWIPNTEALNAQFRGEKNFAGGKVVSNRITIVDTQTGVKTIVDLDALGAGLASPKNCTQPGAVAFDAANNRAYVAAYGSDLVAVLDANTRAWIGDYAVPPSTVSTPARPARSGPRGLWLNTSGTELFVFNKADNSYSRVNLSGGPVFGGTAGAAVQVGYNPTPPAVVFGRGQLITGSNSASGMGSCAVCHIDGNHDETMWELSKYRDPTGTPSNALTFEQDVKGPMATQSLRGLFEAGPYHWRGEQRNLDAFNAAFVGLLKRPAPLSQLEFDDLKAYIFSLVYPSNPRQDVSRTFPGVEGQGLNVFLTAQAEQSTATCAACHTLPLGSSGDLQSIPVGPPTRSAKVAQLRGVADKLGPVFNVGGQIGNRTSTGFGLIHAGSIESLLAFVSDPIFVFNTTQEAQSVAYLNAFDTGLAPATSFQATLLPTDPNLSTTFATVVGYALTQASAGNCDVVLYGTIPTGGGLGTPFTAAYDHTTGLFQTETGGFQVPRSAVLSYIQQTLTPVTVLGLPLGMGWRFGVDRDNDALLNNDEAPVGTSPTNPNFDGDKLPDGHEVANGTPPTVFNTTSPDNVAPRFTAPISMIWSTTNSLKLEFSTSEPSQAWLTFAGIVLTTASPSPKAGGFDVNHAIVLGQLPGGQAGTINVNVVDPAGNVSSAPVNVTTLPRSPCARVLSIQFGAFNPGTSTLPVTVSMDRLNPPSLAVGYVLNAFTYLETSAGLSVISQNLAGTTNAAGQVVFTIPIPTGGPTTNRQLHFGVRHASAPSGTLAPYVEAEDLVNFATSATF